MEKKNIVFEGRLSELPEDAPRCGDLKVAVGYKFTILKIISGKKINGTVVVLVPCPEFKGGNFFMKGQKYQIVSNTDNIEAGSYTIFNQYKNISQILWMQEIVRL